MRQTAGIYNSMGSMTNPSKFLFNVDFSEPEEPEVVAPLEPEIPMIAVADHEKLLADARAQAFEEGRVKALQDLQTKQETLLTAEVDRLVDAVLQVVQTLDEEQAGREQDAISLAFLVARRLCGHLIARQPLAETVALVSECLGPLRKAPHLVIRIAERDVDALKAQVDPIVHEKGFEGRLVILGEPEIDRGDCHIEWADGGIKRDRRALEGEIDTNIKAYLRARGTAKKAKTSDTSAKKDTDV
ncbi:MAG: flagellar assembly protein FliH [Roseibium sp.]|uniref:FliH/SctL family protein n=1 Tax=Roseibium sp. TaxID=1936156 RepID=UPI0026124C1F|nr:FliH/SctL family protein [Roseibium sp.]MCV0423909.1 flagellar assembly protein FliH [Roseibium sp.]